MCQEERPENTGLGCVAWSLGVPKVWKSELQKLQNEVLRRPKALPEASWTFEGAIGTLFGLSLDAPGSPLGAPGSRWDEVLEVLGVPVGTFWVLFWVWGACHCKNTENTEFDDPLRICYVLRIPRPRI